MLGLLAVARYEYETVTLAPGDPVVVCSDGVTEATNLGGEEFGREGVAEAVAHGHGLKPEAMLEQLLDAVRKFSQTAPQTDDITVLILRYRGGSADPPHEP